jgi:hypothetical protein
MINDEEIINSSSSLLQKPRMITIVVAAIHADCRLQYSDAVAVHEEEEKE